MLEHAWAGRHECDKQKEAIFLVTTYHHSTLVHIIIFILSLSSPSTSSLSRCFPSLLLFARNNRFSMSGVTSVDASHEEPVVDLAKEEIHMDVPDVPEHREEIKEPPEQTYQQQEEALKKKYGGRLPKKVPLISKDHERAFFDSADWALGKQGAPIGKPKGGLEELRPKLQPTPHQRSRRSAYAHVDGEDGGNVPDTKRSE